MFIFFNSQLNLKLRIKNHIYMKAKYEINGGWQTCLMSVYTSLRSSSNSLYGSIEDSESVSVSCKVVKRRQWFLWWSDLILFNCFCKKKKNVYSLFCVSEKWLDNIYYAQIYLKCCIQIQIQFFLMTKDRFSVSYAYFPSCRHLAPSSST